MYCCLEEFNESSRGDAAFVLLLSVLTLWFLVLCRFYPDYYKDIKKPMSLYNVRKKIKVSFLCVKFFKPMIGILLYTPEILTHNWYTIVYSRSAYCWYAIVYSRSACYWYAIAYSRSTYYLSLLPLWGHRQPTAALDSCPGPSSQAVSCCNLSFWCRLCGLCARWSLVLVERLDWIGLIFNTQG